MSTSNSERPYHHGDLGQELIAAGVAILEEAGEAELTLREAARRAGVSAMAPYRHFKDKAALLAAIAARGFDLLAERLLAADAEGGDGERLVAQGGAYVRFAAEHPALFDLMFSARCKQTGAPLEASSGRAYGILAQRAAALSATRGEADDLSLAAWSFVHGLAVLVRNGQAPLTLEQTVAVSRRLAERFLLTAPKP